MEKATKLISELKSKVKEYEMKFMQPTRLLTHAKTEPSDKDVEMGQTT